MIILSQNIYTTLMVKNESHKYPVWPARENWAYLRAKTKFLWKHTEKPDASFCMLSKGDQYGSGYFCRSIMCDCGGCRCVGMVAG